MSRTQRFELLLKVARVREQDAARSLAGDKVALQESRGKLQELLVYRTDYAKGISGTGSIGFGVQFRDNCLFLDRLNRAITAQRRQIDERGDIVDASERRWQDAHKQLAILDKVSERARIADRVAMDRRDQKWADELAGAAHARSYKQD